MDKTAAVTLLHALVGEWQGSNRTWFEPDVLADESPIHGVVRGLPATPAVHYQYDTAMRGQPFSGVALFAFNAFTGQFDGAWSDSYHMTTNMMVSRGASCPGGFSLVGSYRDPSGGPAWGWRTTVELADPDQLIVTAYNITPTGDEAKAVEARLVRVPRA